MLSLASLRYRDVFSEDGGPIAQVLTGSFPILGEPHHQANAFLTPELSAGKPSHALYGQADGTGSAPSSEIACHMAISEALERWAFLATQSGRDSARFAFDRDPSSNGMAAYPGLLKSQAARRARSEALERHALISWWDGRVDAEPVPCFFPGVNAYRIRHTWRSGEVVVLEQPSRAGVAYGHAAATTVARASLRAAIELARNSFVLTQHRARGALTSTANFLERRALHFSTPDGHARFLDRLRRPAWKGASAPAVLFDGEIPGPWSRWTTVWRHAVAMPTAGYLDQNEDFFFW